MTQKKVDLKDKYGEENWRPYCLVCTTMMRMEKTHYGFKCRNSYCLNEIKKDLTHKDK